MGQSETSMGGGGDAFPQTPWSTVLTAPEPASPVRRERLTLLCSLYWRPVYRYIRAAWRKPVEDAKDLAQEFFRHVLEQDLAFRHDPEQGRFRSYLKASLKNFLANEGRDAGRLKRGGGREIVVMEVDRLEREAGAIDAASATPEEIFDLQWARDVIAQAVEELRRRLASEGKEKYFQVYERYDLFAAGGARPTYDSLAQALGLSVDDVKNYLTAARARFRAVLVERVADSVAGREHLERELREVFPGY
jgi:RNA polymerase sigma-70 factor (ECF subfamily)